MEIDVRGQRCSNDLANRTTPRRPHSVTPTPPTVARQSTDHLSALARTEPLIRLEPVRSNGQRDLDRMIERGEFFRRTCRNPTATDLNRFVNRE
jgi:hypothetical protein